MHFIINEVTQRRFEISVLGLAYLTRSISSVQVYVNWYEVVS